MRTVPFISNVGCLDRLHDLTQTVLLLLLLICLVFSRIS